MTCPETSAPFSHATPKHLNHGKVAILTTDSIYFLKPASMGEQPKKGSFLPLSATWWGGGNTGKERIHYLLS